MLQIALPSDAGTLDPLFAVDLVSQKLNRLLFRSLFLLKDGKVLPDLAESYELKTNTFLVLNLKPALGARAEDVRFSLDRLRTTKSPRKSMFNDLKSVSVLDGNRVGLQFEGSPEKVFELLASPLASIYSEKEFLDSESFVSYGPYRLETWKRGEFLHLILRNSEETSLPPELMMRILPNTGTAIYLFNKGEIDILRIPFYLLENPAIQREQLISVRGKSIQYISIFWEDPCLDKNFRLALNHSIDRETIIEKVFHSKASGVYLAFPPEYTFPENRKPRFQFSYDIQLAKKYLESSSCYPEILKRPIELRMRGDEENRAKGLAIYQNLKDLSLNVKLLPLEKANLYRDNGQKKGELTLLTWYLDFDSALNFLDPLFFSNSPGNGGNRTFYRNPEMDEVILKSRQKGDLDADSQAKSLELLESDLPWIFLWSLDENYLVSKQALLYSQNNLLLF